MRYVSLTLIDWRGPFQERAHPHRPRAGTERDWRSSLGRYMSMMRTKAKKRLCFVAIIVSFSSRLTCVFASRGRKQVVVTFAYAASEANELVTKIKKLV